MNISIIICTYNRADMLRQTLQAIKAVSIPESTSCELIVVDNASTDHTTQVVSSCDITSLKVRYIHEPRRGQVQARNTGIAVAKGEIVLFTDDDVVPSHDWINGMCAPISSGQAEAVRGGVKIAPHLLRDWMTPQHRIYLADTTVPNASNSADLIGANMAFSRTVLNKVPFFDTELGPGALGFWDDLLFSKQLTVAGYRIASSIDICVEHHFDASRLSRLHFLDRFNREGRSAAYVAHHWRHETIPNARLLLMRTRLRLIYYRNFYRARWAHPEGMSCWEMAHISYGAFLQHYLHQRNLPHNYHQNGLVKVSNS